MDLPALISPELRVQIRNVGSVSGYPFRLANANKKTHRDHQQNCFVVPAMVCMFLLNSSTSGNVELFDDCTVLLQESVTVFYDLTSLRGSVFCSI